MLVGGTENMSQAPHVIRGARDGFAFGRAPALEDSLAAALTDTFCNTPMAITAENLAQKYGLTREDCDRFALLSQQRWAAATETGAFKDEITTVEIAGQKGSVVVSKDEHPRPQTTLETLAKLPPAFKKDGVVTAGNASGINDGAGALVLTSEEFASARGLKPLARLVQWGVAARRAHHHGHRPGPGHPARARSARAPRSTDIDLVEVNEAFAAQYLAVEKELGLDREQDQRQRRRHRHRPPARRHRRAHHRAPRLRAAPPQPEHRRRLRLHRRRPGARGAHRAHLIL